MMENFHFIILTSFLWLLSITVQVNCSSRSSNTGWQSSSPGWGPQPVQPAPIAGAVGLAPVPGLASPVGLANTAPVAQPVGSAPNPPNPPPQPSPESPPSPPNAPQPGWAPLEAPPAPQPASGWGSGW